MKTTGIVAEYNPFHNGHQYHIEETKKQTGADYVIAVMSGDFVQRGAPAFLDKYERTRAALAGGCDLVLELPVIYSSSSAEFFAAGAVNLFNRLGVCSYLSFGSEEGSLASLLTLADILSNEPEEYKLFLQDLLKTGLSFPAAREKALCQYFQSANLCYQFNDFSSFLNGSNNILALEYLKSLKKTCSSIKPYTVLRKNAHYHDKNLHDSISSASAVRDYVLKKGAVDRLSANVPEETFHSIHCVREKDCGFPDYDDLTPYLHAVLLSGIEPELYLDWDKELANRLKQIPWPILSFTQIADRLKSRNITHSRIYRALLHLILGVEKDRFYQQFNHNPIPYARILGFRKESSKLLKEINRQGSVPLITKPSSILKVLDEEDLWMWKKDLAASQLYQSIQFTHYHYRLPSAYERSPVVWDRC